MSFCLALTTNCFSIGRSVHYEFTMATVAATVAATTSG
jgi:hypothetical protein